MNNKGFTVVELIASFALTMVLGGFLLGGNYGKINNGQISKYM